IGVGFYWHGDEGTLGNPHHDMDAHEAWAMLGNIMAAHVMAWAIAGLLVLVLLLRFDLTAFPMTFRNRMQYTDYKSVHPEENQPIVSRIDFDEDNEDGCNAIELTSAA